MYAASDDHPVCGGYTEDESDRGLQVTSRLWDQGLVRWSFVSRSDSIYTKDAIYTDDTIGMSATDLGVMMESMNVIMNVTCVKFQYDPMPVPNKPWLLLMKESHDDICYKNYIYANLKDVEVKNKNGQNLGRIFRKAASLGSCFSGAYATFGASSPSVMVSSQHKGIAQNDVGLFVHEFLHTLGIGHTQTRPGEHR